MIRRFKKVDNNLYRGSAPSPRDIVFLKKIGIKKIVSLDEQAGRRIDRATKLLGIKHVMLPIEIGKKRSLINFLKQDIEKLFIDGGPTFVHCKEGKDRTGLAVAMYRCEHDDWSCGEALMEAERLGFGIGVDPRVVKLYHKLIKKSCRCKEKDFNAAYDIVSNQREYPSDYMDYSLDNFEQQSWSPYEDYRIKNWPYANEHIDWEDQYPSRLNYGLNDGKNNDDYHDIPQIGSWDSSTQGINGAGPSFVGSGFV